MMLASAAQAAVSRASLAAATAALSTTAGNAAVAAVLSPSLHRLGLWLVRDSVDDCPVVDPWAVPFAQRFRQVGRVASSVIDRRGNYQNT